MADSDTAYLEEQARAYLSAVVKSKSLGEVLFKTKQTLGSGYLLDYHAFTGEEDCSDISRCPAKKCFLFTRNSLQNINFVYSNWDSLIKNRNLRIVFISRTGGRWALNPAVHSIVAEHDTLKQGLIAMAEEAGLDDNDS